MATDGGIRYRTETGDFIFHSEQGLETTSFYAVVSSGLGVFAVSEYGLVAALAEDGKSWKVLNRSFVQNSSRVIPGKVKIQGQILVIPFEDRLAIFDLPRSSSILTIDRIDERTLSSVKITDVATTKDSIYVKLENEVYAREMDWDNLWTDVFLSDPGSWEKVSRSVSEFKQIDSSVVRLDDGDTLAFPLLFDSGKSKVRWNIKVDDSYFLVCPNEIYLYRMGPKEREFFDLTINENYVLGDTYEVSAVPVGGVIAASPEGAFSFGNGVEWGKVQDFSPGFGSFSSATSSKMKVLSILPDGHVFFHVWGRGYFIYSNWGEDLEHSFYPQDGHCFDNYLENYSIAVASTPAPDGSGFLTATADTMGYSIVYFTKDGEVHCAKQVGTTNVAGPMKARIDDDGSWLIYVGAKEGTNFANDGWLDVFRFAPPKSNGGELSKGKLTTYRGITPSPLDMVYDDVEKRMWLVSMSGIAYLDNDADTLIQPASANGLQGAEYTSIDRDSHGNLWVGTSNQGVYRLTQKGKSPDTLSVKHFSSKNGMLSDNVSDLAIDSVLGVVWLAHEKGVTAYFRNDLKATAKNMTSEDSIGVRAYPIPFRPKIHAYFTIDNITEDAVVSIYNRGGALIKSFRNGDVVGGKMEWDGRDDSGRLVTPGVYYYVVNASGKSKKGKFIIIH